MQLSTDTRIAELLARARQAAKLEPIVPANPAELLRPILFIYWRQPQLMRALNCSTLQTALDLWLFPFTSKDAILEHLAIYPSYDYPDTCFCGSVNNNYGSVLRYDCKRCCGNNNYWWWRQDFISMIGMIGANYNKHIPIPVTRLESILAEVIYGYSIKQT